MSIRWWMVGVQILNWAPLHVDPLRPAGVDAPPMTALFYLTIRLGSESCTATDGDRTVPGGGTNRKSNRQCPNSLPWGYTVHTYAYMNNKLIKAAQLPVHS